ncbi:MAG: hypothetical protein NTX91_01305 [candidate division SR1 bacterium]|nr:hypothetical protein [candidate division SR1 bacterium]
MKKNLLALAALGASVALLAGCGSATPEVTPENGAVVEAPVVDTTATTTADTGTTTTTTTPATTPTTTTTTPATAE